MEEDELAAMRAEKLMHSADSRKKLIILQFVFVCTLLVAYFIGDYIYELSILNSTRLVYEHMKLINTRSSIVKFRILFTMEYIMTAEMRLETSIAKYQDDIYENDKSIHINFLEDYPG